jgi:hypothetical protein
MATPEQHERIADLMLACTMLAMSKGVPYNEAIVSFKASAALMEQIHKTPDAGEDAMEAFSQSIVDAEIAAAEVAKP